MTAFDPTKDSAYLEKLLNEEPTEIIIGLESTLYKFKQVLKRCRTDKDLQNIKLLIKTINKAFLCKSMSNNLRVIVDAVIEENLIQAVVFEFMITETHSEISETFVQEATEDLLCTCIRITETFPDSLTVIFGLYELMSLLVASFHSKGESWRNLNKKTIYEQFTVFTDYKCSLLRKWIQAAPSDSLSHINTSEESKHFRNMRIIPTFCRVGLSADSGKFLRKNKIGSAYESLDEYLDIHFRLLREDFMIPLRRGIEQYLDTTSNDDRRRRNPYIRVYKDVCISAPVCKKEVLFTVRFRSKNLKRIKWERSKRLLHGALVCVSPDNFRTMYFGTVGERNPAALRQGNVRVKFESALKNVYSLADSQCIMIETNALFEAYRHVLQSLQNTNTLPFQEYIIKCDSNVKPPKYLLRKNHVKIDLSPLVQNDYVCIGENNLAIYNDEDMKRKENKDQYKHESLTDIDILDLKSWPEHDKLNLDESQYRALQTSLTKEFAVVQGPPGTGKTYVGLQVVKVLLRNQKMWSCRIRTHQNKHYQKIFERKQGTKSLDIAVYGVNVENVPMPNLEDECELQTSSWDAKFISDASRQTDVAFVTGSEQTTNEETVAAINTDAVSNSNSGSPLNAQNACNIETGNLLHVANQRLKSEYSVIEDPRPILVVCYTNHALDQFLEGIVRSYKGDVLRVGGKSKSEILAKHTLFQIRQNFPFSKPLTEVVKHTKRNVYKLKKHVCECSAEIDVLKKGINHAHFFHSTNKALDQLQEHFLWWSQQVERNYEQKRYMQLLEPSPTVIWLGLFEKLDEIVEGFTRQVEGTNTAKDEHYIPLNPCLYDMSDEPYTFVEDVQYSVRGMTCLSIETVQQCQMSFVKPKYRYNVQQEFLRYLKAQILSTDIMSDEEEDYYANNIISLSTVDRWRLYRKWVKQHLLELEQNIELSLAQLERECRKKHELSMQEDKEIMRRSTIIGMTTTCAAKYHTILNEVKPRIVIIEEAAEVFEAHIISCLNMACDQLILIGDHKQLRPTPATYELALKYHLDISLFERVVKAGIHCDCLQLQHRMRPVIANNVRLIYPSLRDHESVNGYENIRGIANDLFFVSHDHDEIYDEEQKSYSNQHEATFVISLAQYIIQQGYEPFNVTILTTYKGQLFLLQRLLMDYHFPQQNLTVTVVDNYQGEENEIVILSLVRSNKDGNIGFLKKSNRICVALSRAKKGFYIIGNLNKLAENSTLWKDIRTGLIEKALTDKHLPLYCQNHMEAKVFVSSAEDFHKVPEGGCQKDCDGRLPCGHVCERKCHILDSRHVDVICKKQCIRKCQNGHPCKKRCHNMCGPCQEYITITLKCGHEKAVVCHNELNQQICHTKCNKILQCGHRCEKKCWEMCYPCQTTYPASIRKCQHDIKLICGSSEIPACKENCRKKLQCGHICKKNCGLEPMILDRLTEGQVQCEIKHTKFCYERCNATLICNHKCTGKCLDCYGKRLHSPCGKPCNCDLACGHQCEGMCGDCFPCERRCQISCSHGKCQKQCKEPCIKCEKPCIWQCQHFKCTATCSEPCNRPRCNEPCTKTRDCGHKCIGLCGEPCPQACRICDKVLPKQLGLLKNDTQDLRVIELEECEHLVEYKQMDRYMDQEETPVRLKRCPECFKPIRRSSRYGNVVKRIISMINNAKVNASHLETKQDRVLRYIHTKNVQNIKRVLKEIRIYFCSDAAIELIYLAPYPTFLTEIIQRAEKLAIENPSRSLLVSHQGVLDTSLEVKRHFDLNLLCMYKAKVLFRNLEIPSKLKTSIDGARELLGMKTRYDSANQIVVENCLDNVARKLGERRLVILKTNITPTEDRLPNAACLEDTQEFEIAETMGFDSCKRQQLEVNLPNEARIIYLQLYIPATSPFYHCGKDCLTLLFRSVK